MYRAGPSRDWVNWSPDADVGYPPSPPLNDGGRTVLDLANTFVATIKEARAQIDNIHSSFCNTIWPSMKEDLDTAKFQVIELEMKLRDAETQAVKKTKVEMEGREEWQRQLEDVMLDNVLIRIDLDTERARNKALQETMDELQHGLILLDSEKARNKALQETMDELQHALIHSENQRTDTPPVHDNTLRLLRSSKKGKGPEVGPHKGGCSKTMPLKKRGRDN